MGEPPRPSEGVLIFLPVQEDDVDVTVGMQDGDLRDQPLHDRKGVLPVADDAQVLLLQVNEDGTAHP